MGLTSSCRFADAVTLPDMVRLARVWAQRRAGESRAASHLLNGHGGLNRLQRSTAGAVRSVVLV